LALGIPSARISKEQGEERMYIGLGTIVLILLVVLLVRAL
jgi:hypothetical protein